MASCERHECCDEETGIEGLGRRPMAVCYSAPMFTGRITPVAGLLSAVLLSAAAAGPHSSSQDEKSKNPPPGAPWGQSFEAVRAQALEAGKPIFLYSTKTY